MNPKRRRLWNVRLLRIPAEWPSRIGCRRHPWPTEVRGPKWFVWRRAIVIELVWWSICIEAGTRVEAYS